MLSQEQLVVMFLTVPTVSDLYALVLRRIILVWLTLEGTVGMAQASDGVRPG